MDIQDLLRDLQEENGTRIVLVVADGLGGLPREPGGRTELETATTPNLDRLAERGVSGLLTPVLPGITCGSGPGHLALFGYDPLRHAIGRGVLSALGIDFDLRPGDIAARGNFCTVNDEGTITDRRAGRIPTDEGARLVEKLRGITIQDVQLFVDPVKEYRFAVVLRGEGLEADVEDVDPHRTGVAPREPRAGDPDSGRTAEVVKEFLRQARERLEDEQPANMVILRGFAQRPSLPSIRDNYGLDACALAAYPMYRGLSRLLGMRVLPPEVALEDRVGQLDENFDRHTFFFLHAKHTDSLGEDGDFDGKVRAIEELDAQIPRITALKPDVLIVTGDHSTPSRLRGHSWHPVPVVLAAETCRADPVSEFGETACLRGALGQFEAKHLMALALAHARRLSKFGA